MKLPQGAEWLILLLIVVLLFGAKRLPDAARGLGRSLRIFKAETKALTDDGSAAATEPSATAGQAPAAPPAVAAAPEAPASPVVDSAAPAADPAAPVDQRPA